jgi:8-oxo-dGTP pyrophosphatase MutT (NUDIX family)
VTDPGPIDETWYERQGNVPEHLSAGGVVVRLAENQVWVSLGRQIGYQAYVLPKGHVDPGESCLEAARREIAEEAGFTDLTLLCELGCLERYDYLKTAWKKTAYFLFSTREVHVQPTEREKHAPPAWFPIQELPPIFWPEQRALVEDNRPLIERLVRSAGTPS